MTYLAAQQAAGQSPSAPRVVRRLFGSLDAITDSERRSLRPIGMTVREVAARTSALVAELCTRSDVRIFQGVRPALADEPCIPHVIGAGRRVIFVESVAWPPGRYVTTAAGRIYCDGVYIGQSIRPLTGVLRYWREILPPGHEVRAIVIAHPAGAGELVLPSPATPGLTWAVAGKAIHSLRGCLPRDRQAMSTRAIAVLIAATVGEATSSSGGPAR